MKMNDRQRKHMILACAIAASTRSYAWCTCAMCISYQLDDNRVSDDFWYALGERLGCGLIAAEDAAEAECLLREGWDPE